MYTAQRHQLVFEHEEPGLPTQHLLNCNHNRDATRLAEVLNAMADLELNAAHTEQHGTQSKDVAAALGMRLDKARSAFLDLHSWVCKAGLVVLALLALSGPALAGFDEPYVPKRSVEPYQSRSLDDVAKSLDQVATEPESRGHITLQGNPRQEPSQDDIDRVERSIELRKPQQ